MQAELQCEQPNASLYTFTGNLLLAPPLTEAAQTVPLSPASILLRGSSLRNTKRVLGVVVFAGHETKASSCSVSLTCPTLLCLKGLQQPELCLDWCQCAAAPYLDILCPSPTWPHSTRRQCRRILAISVSASCPTVAISLQQSLYSFWHPLRLVTGAWQHRTAVGEHSTVSHLGSGADCTAACFLQAPALCMSPLSTHSRSLQPDRVAQELACCDWVQVMMNATLPPSKRSRVEREMDILILFMFALLLAMCIIGAVFFGAWTHSRSPNMWWVAPLRV